MWSLLIDNGAMKLKGLDIETESTKAGSTPKIALKPRLE
jgi:hypothetical protein